MNRSIEIHKRVRNVQRSTSFKGYFEVQEYTLEHRTHEGGWSSPIQREVFERGHVVIVLPYDPWQDTVVLVEQFRIGAYAAGLEPWLTEAVAGTIEPGESAEEVAHREAMEEAGCTLTEMESIGTMLMSPGSCTETAAMFCARVDSRELGGIHGLADEGEDIKARVVPLKEAFDQLESGQISNGYAVIPLQWLALNRNRLRTIWR